MSDQNGSGPTVLIADRNLERADEYARWLEGGCLVGTVETGERVLTAVDERDVDVVLLAGALADTSRDEVALTVRARGLETRVVLLSETFPDGDPLERGYDDYLVGRVGPPELAAMVAKLAEREPFESIRAERSSLRVRRELLEQELPEAVWLHDDRYNRTLERLERLERLEAAYRASVGRATADAVVSHTERGRSR